MSPSQHPKGRAVFPNFVRSACNGRDFFSELEHCQHLFWNLTGESVESFLQIVQDVGPTIYSQGGIEDRSTTHTYWICVTGFC